MDQCPGGPPLGSGEHLVERVPSLRDDLDEWMYRFKTLHSRLIMLEQQARPPQTPALTHSRNNRHTACILAVIAATLAGVQL